MNTKKLSRALAGLLLAATALLTAPAFAQSTTGAVKGRVTDENGAALPGVTVTVTGPKLQGEQTEFTDDGGNYIITQLPPGDYLVRFYFANVTGEANIHVNAEKTLGLNYEIKTKEVKGETHKITQRAPTVDIGSTQVVTTVTNELVRNTPIRGRTYEAVLALAPGAAGDAVGPSMGGATGNENNYLLDGLNTTDNGFGLVGTPLTLEFLEETNIITGGYRAEYGRATGGVVSLVTKSGSNDIKGSVWFNGQGVLADPPLVARLGESIGAYRRRSNQAFDFGFEVGGPVVKDWVWFYAGVAPNLVTDQYRRVIRTRVIADNSAIPAGAASYAGDTMKDPACPDYLKGGANSAICLTPGSTTPLAGYATAEVPGASQTFESNSRLVNYIAKLDFRFSDDHRASIAYIGSPSSFAGVYDNPRNPNSLGLGFNSDPNTMHFNEDIGVHDIVAHLNSKLLDRKLQVHLTAGWHSQSDTVTPTAQATGWVRDTRTRDLGAFEDVRGTIDGVANQNVCSTRMVPVKDAQGNTTGMAAFNPCPVSSYSYGGFGFFNTLNNDRLSLALDATYYAEAAGTHAIKFGGDFENNRYKDFRAYTGSTVGGRFYVLSDGTMLRTQFGTIDDSVAGGKVVLTPDGFTAETRTLNESFYLQDSYSASFLPGLTIDVGLRWEFQQVKDIDGNTAFAINDNISPRLGVIYDWTQKGLGKVFANYGRFYESIPLDINDRSFSKEALVDLYTSNCKTDANGNLDPRTCRFDPATRGDAYGGELSLIQPNLKGQFSDQVLAGVEYDVGWDLVLGATYVHKAIGRVIEDVSPDGGNTYVIANPGSATDPDVVSDLVSKLKAAQAAVKAAEAGTDAAKLQNAQHNLDRASALLSNYKDIQTFPEATRTYNAMVLTARKRLTQNLQILASYTYSRTLGNYPGLFQDSNGQLDPNISTQYDIKDLLANRAGPLPNDRPHNFKFLGSYFIPLGTSEKDKVILGLTFNAISGSPIEVLGRHPIYGADETFILPRGAGGRTPWVTSVDARVGYAKDIGSGYQLELALDIFNVLNQQAVTAVDEEYTTERVLSIKNGTVDDLATLKGTNGQYIRRSPNYGQATGYQAPIAGRLGARITF